MSEQAILEQNDQDPIPEGQAEAEMRDQITEKAKAKVEAESKAIAKDIAKQDAAIAHKFVSLGERCHKFLIKAKAVGYSAKEARGMLEADILVATRVDWSKEITRAIKVYHVHAYYGEGVLSLPLDMQKALSSFMEEDEETGEWGPEGKFADKVQKLYDQVTNGKKRTMTAQEFRANLNLIKRPNSASKPELSDSGSRPEVSPAGEKPESEPLGDLGVPPISSGNKTAPGLAAVQASKVLCETSDDITSSRMLGQKLTIEQATEVFLGMIDGIKSDENRRRAADNWDHVRAIIDGVTPVMNAMFPSPQQQSRKSA